MCKFPQYFVKDGKLQYWKCGKCSDCLNEKRKDYVQRCYLELYAPKPHRVTPKFWTFTFDEYWYNLLNTQQVGASDLWQKFEKRLRKYVCTKIYKNYPSIRFFRAAELGKKGHRLHFHAIYFNLPYISVYEMRKIWSYGNVQVKAMEHPERGIVYTTKYVNKCSLSREEKRHFGIYRPISCSRNLGMASKKLQDKTFLLHLAEVPKIKIGKFPYRLSDYYRKKLFQSENTSVELYLAFYKAQEIRKNYQKSKNYLIYGTNNWYRNSGGMYDDCCNLRNIAEIIPRVERYDSENRYFQRVGSRYRFFVEDRNEPPITPKPIFVDEYI